MTCVLLLDMFFTAADLARLRRCLTDTARLAGLAEPRRSEFVLAVHEVTGWTSPAGRAARSSPWSSSWRLRVEIRPDWRPPQRLASRPGASQPGERGRRHGRGEQHRDRDDRQQHRPVAGLAE